MHAGWAWVSAAWLSRPAVRGVRRPSVGGVRWAKTAGAARAVPVAAQLRGGKDVGEEKWSTTEVLRWSRSAFAVWMDRVETVEEEEEDEMALLLRKKGAEFEAGVLRRIGEKFGKTVDLRYEKSWKATEKAMNEGADVIYQASVEFGRLKGVADFLIRTESGEYSVWDAKSARSAKPDDFLQVAAYADVLRRQGMPVARMGNIVFDGGESQVDTVLHAARWRRLESRFLKKADEFSNSKNVQLFLDESLDGGVPLEAHGKFARLAESRLREKDDVRFVAGLTARHRRILNKNGVNTMQSLADLDLRRGKIRGMSRPVTSKLRDQAKLQKQSHKTLQYKQLGRLLDPEKLGIYRSESPFDVYFDLEGDPLIGLEYLWGWVDGNGAYTALWAHDSNSEDAAFLEFLTLIESQIQLGGRVYHYGHYETSTLSKLAMRAGRDVELRYHAVSPYFVDLYAVVKKSLLIGGENYSLKTVEQLYRGKRQLDVSDALGSVVAYEKYLVQRDDSILHDIQSYNQDDCVSTRDLRLWLLSRLRFIPPNTEEDDEDDDENENEKDEATAAKEERRALREEAKKQAETELRRVFVRDADTAVGWLDYHLREQRPTWRQRREWLSESTSADLCEDERCLGAAKLIGPVETQPSKSRRVAYAFRAPSQPTRLAAFSRVTLRDDQTFLTRNTKNPAISDERYLSGDVVSVHRDHRLVVTVLCSSPPPASCSMVPDEFFDPEPIPTALARNLQAPTPALVDFILRRPPRFLDGFFLSKTDSSAEAVTAAVAAMDSTTLAIQGPPGTGKTYVAAFAAAELLRRGHKIAVTAPSHDAIERLLAEILDKVTGTRDVLALKIGQKKKEPEQKDSSVTRKASYDEKTADLVKREKTKPVLVGGTAWTLARPAAEGAFDWLLVDEAGQMPAATLAGVAGAARNLVLVGDQRQLPAPTQAAHPYESGASCLEHYLSSSPNDDEKYDEVVKKIFLKSSRRMRPELCRAVSELAYDGLLESHPTASERALTVASDDPFPEAGLCLVQVDVFSRDDDDEETAYLSATANEAEAVAVASAVDVLLTRTVRESPTSQRPLRQSDVLVVAPYNAHARLVSEELARRGYPDVAVGTVDRFQGQEALCVVASLCAPGVDRDEDSTSRGVDFVLDVRRLNVAVSRAQCLAVLVTSPHLLDAPSGNSLDKLNLLARFARLAELATRVLDFHNSSFLPVQPSLFDALSPFAPSPGIRGRPAIHRQAAGG